MSESQQEIIFNFKSVFFQIEEKTILKNIATEIPTEGITGIIGPSGAGKSTLLRLLNKLISPTEGKIIYNSQELASLPSQQLRKEIGMVQQQPYLFDGTVKENLLYGPDIWGIDYSDDELVELLERVALDGDFLTREVDSLSGGEQQRVSIARSLANNPQVILLDEPTSSLDIVSEESIEKTIELLAKDGIKIIIITHSLEQTERLTDNLLFLREGELVEKSKTMEFFKHYDAEEIRSFFKKQKGDENE